ncbi:MAG: hypothetical protein AUG51_20235 [Acidobacteria bacterium 13_1_20CM_3_53_8]|nr:MAG: hypothetical protein AUG51_20235 [Acidobacteria bacterium 13_1_20CM_3_53_8]
MRNELLTMSLAEVARLVRERSVSPVELMKSYLRRIEELNPRLNAIVTLAPDALDLALEAGKRIARGANVGTLEGIPFTVKDTIETKDLRTTSGSLMRAEHVPKRDATAVARLKRAGAILLGKTNVAEMAMHYDSSNPVFGRTNNPHDLARTPGGSSGGEAAAVSACLSPAGLGSDLAGSVRIPAHFCGVVGLKPTAGSVPGRGQFPPAEGPYSLGASIGPIARRVEDLALLFAVISEPDGSTRATNKLSGFQNDVERLREHRVAYYTDDGVVPVTDETKEALAHAARALEDAGLVVEQVRPPCVERGAELWPALFSRMSIKLLQELYEEAEEKAGEFVRAMLKVSARTAQASDDELIDAWLERDSLRRQLIEWMAEKPLILAPVGAVAAFEHGARKVEVKGEEIGIFRAFSYSQTYNVFDLPSASVPAGRTREGLPIGVQIIGKPFAEKMVLAAASIIEKSLGGWVEPKDFGI